MVVATPLAFVGVATYFASSTVLSMLALSDQYAAATIEAQRTTLLAAGQAVLALNHPGAVYQGTGIYLSFLLLAVAGLLVSGVMLRSTVFSNLTAYVGILAGVLDLTYGVTFAFAPGLTVYLLSAAGLLLMVWHVLVG